MPLDKYKSGRNSMGFMAPLGPIFQHSTDRKCFLLDTVDTGISEIYSRLYG